MLKPEQRKSVPDWKENAQENNDLKAAQNVEEQIAPENYEKLSEEELGRVAAGVWESYDGNCPKCGSSNSEFAGKWGTPLYQCLDCRKLFLKCRKRSS